MINHKHKFLYLHIPKTGGTSINKFFNDKFKDNKRDFGHPYLSDYGDNLNDYFKFTIVRNPWDRLISAFFYITKYTKFTFDKVFCKRFNMQNDTFESFVIDKLPIILKDPSIRPRHFKPQVDFGTDGLDYVGSFNTIQDDMNYVCDKIGIKLETIPHKNKSLHEDYNKYYTPELLDIVYNLYINDFKKHNNLF